MQKLTQKISVDDFTDCHIWKGKSPIMVSGRVWTPRRAAYELYIGQPLGNVKNICGDRRCVNPLHLEARVADAE